MFRDLDVQMLKCLDTWILGCSDAHVDCSKHCALPYNQLLSHSCPLCYNSWSLRHILIKYNGYSTLCLCNVIFSIAQKFLCVCLAMCISIYIYDCCVFAVNQGVFAVHATFGPLHRGGSRQWNQEVLCLTQPPPSSSTHCKGIWQCKESSSHSAAALLQCRETRHAQNVPPFSHSGGGRPLLPVTDLNHRIFSILDIRFTHGRFYRLICPLCV